MTQPAAQTASLGVTYGAVLDPLKWWKITLPSDATQVLVSIGNTLASGASNYSVYATFSDVAHDSAITDATSSGGDGETQIQWTVDQDGSTEITIPVKQGTGRKTATFALGSGLVTLYISFMAT